MSKQEAGKYSVYMSDHCFGACNPEKTTALAHLSWCGISTESINYEKLPWYKKIFIRNPRNLYD